MGCEQLIEVIDKYIVKADKKLVSELAKKGYARPKRTLRFIELMEAEMAEALIEETDYFLKHIEESVDLETFAAETWPELVINDALKAKAAMVFVEQMHEFMPEFINVYLKLTDKGLLSTGMSKRTEAWIHEWGTELGKKMQLTSHKQLEDILAKGLKEGAGIPELTRAIQDSGIRNEQFRARRVALTEVLRAHSVAQQEAFEKSPAVEEKMWRHTTEYRNTPRPNHAAIDGQRVPVKEPFVLPGADGIIYYPMYPRDTILPPSESVNCHCIMQPIASKEALGLSLEDRQALQREAEKELDEEWERKMNEKYRKLYGGEDY